MKKFEKFSIWKHYEREDWIFIVIMIVILSMLIGFIIGINLK